MNFNCTQMASVVTKPPLNRAPLRCGEMGEFAVGMIQHDAITSKQILEKHFVETMQLKTKG